MTTIDSSIAPKLAQWFISGREVFTPGDASQPGWRYGNPVDLQPEDIEVEVFTPVSSFRGRFKIEANARLIAAAPDLLEALQSVIGWANDFNAPLGTVNGDAACWNEARAAIARATGHAQEISHP